MLICALLALSLLVHASDAAAGKSKRLISVNEDNWRMLLEGSWMIEFHAPWCPACKDLQKSWNAFADWSKDLDIKVAEVDVTVNPGLSGRFLVTALPTVYHVKEGVFRSYTGPRDKEDFISFVEDKKWTVIDPVASWKHPDSPQMGIVAMFFKLSMHVRDIHNHLVEDRGIPSWASYLLFGGITLLLGCVLGFLIVCVIDLVFPAMAPKAPVQTAKEKKEQRKKKKEQQKKSEDRKSQDEHSQNSQTEEESSADESSMRQRKSEKAEKKANSHSATDSKKKK